jgi:hypothetical protein
VSGFSMRRQLTAGAFVFLAGLVPAMTASAVTDFRGGGFLTDFTNCGDSGWSGTQIVRVRAQPAGLIGNSADFTRLSMTFGTSALNYRIPAGDLVDWVTASSGQIFAGYAGDIPTQFRLTYLSTPEIDDTTIYATVEFELLDFAGDEGCAVRGRAFIARN